MAYINGKKIIYGAKVVTGYAQGREDEYNAFWDVVQENGNRTNYAFAFSADLWTPENFKPKYPIRPVGSANNMMAYWGQSYGANGSLRIDLREVCTLDTSACTSINSAFYLNTVVKAVGVLDTRNISGLSTTFGSAYNVETVEKVILRDDGSQTFNNAFNHCNELVNITFEGVIGQNGLAFAQSKKLSKASWISIINALSTSTSGLTVTGSLASVKKAFETKLYEGDGNELVDNGDGVAKDNNVYLNSQGINHFITGGGVSQQNIGQDFVTGEDADGNGCYFAVPKIDSNASNPELRNRLPLFTTIEGLTVGEKYIISAYVKLPAGSSKTVNAHFTTCATYAIQCALDAYATNVGNTITLTNEWQKVELVIDYKGPGNGVKGSGDKYLGLVINTPAAVCVDNISIQKAVDKGGANNGDTTQEWLNLVATKPNWNIALG